MKKFWIILIIILTVPTFYQLLRSGFFFMQDDLQAMRVHQMFACFRDLQIPCRWVPDMGYGYGYPQFIYYPPSVYYLGAIFHLFGIQIIDAVKALFILGYILSALAMFLFLQAIFSRWIAFAGAMLYTYIPYKALEVYVRGALNEFWSLVLFPLIFWAIYQLINKEKLKYALFLALGVAALMLTHNLMTLIFAPVAIAWIVVLLVLKRSYSVIPKIILGGVVGLGLASFFILPLLFETKYAHLETLVGGYFDYRLHFVNLNRLFISNLFGYGSSGIGHDNNLTLSTGQVQWMLAAVGFVLAPFFLKKYKNISLLIIIFSVIELLVLFLIHQKSSFIWEKIPVMVYLQFPWRFLTVSIFLLSFLGAGTIFLISKINLRLALTLTAVVLIGIFALHASFYQPKEWYGISDKDKFSGPFWEKELTISIFDYLPIYAKLPPNKEAPKLPEVLRGEVEFLSYQKGSNYQTGQISAKEDSIIRLPLFDFPGMKVTIDGQEVGHRNDDCRGQEYCFGLITVAVPPGNHTLKARLLNTPVRQIGDIITLGSLVVMAGLIGKIYGFNKIHS